MAVERVARWTLTRCITITVGRKEKCVKLVSSQRFTDKKTAHVNMILEQNRVTAAMKAVYSEVPSKDDIICIGSITVDARTIVAAEFAVRRVTVVDDVEYDAEGAEEISGEVANAAADSIPGAQCVTDDEDD